MEEKDLLTWGIFFGIIGLGYFIYGRKQKAVVPLLVGISLFIFPYFITNLYLLIATGMVLIVLPYFVKI